MANRRAVLAGVAASLLVLTGALSGCVPEADSAPSATPSGSASAPPTETPEPSASPSDTGLAVPLPTDCREILNASVLAELGTTPLNDPAFGPSGVQGDGSLICVWGDPAADTTHLTTTIMYVSRGPALDMLNGLADAQGFTCFTPDGGTRCEMTWENETYPVTDGRTLFWRDDILIDTQYSNLAPSGYTSAIVASVFG